MKMWRGAERGGGGGPGSGSERAKGFSLGSGRHHEAGCERAAIPDEGGVQSPDRRGAGTEKRTRALADGLGATCVSCRPVVPRADPAKCTHTGGSLSVIDYVQYTTNERAH